MFTFKYYLVLFIDSSGEAVPTKATATFRLDFSRVYTALCRGPPSDQTTLLLYLLLHRNPAMRTFLLARADIELLVRDVILCISTKSNNNN
jgi:hypothetical protein